MKRNVRSYAGRLGWERIAFAIAVVGERAIGTFPGIVASDRTDAQTFLTQKKSSPASAGSVADAGRAVSEGLATGLIQDPKREISGALSGSSNLFVSKEIVLLLAALISGRNTIKSPRWVGQHLTRVGQLDSPSWRPPRRAHQRYGVPEPSRGHRLLQWSNRRSHDR